MVKRREFLRYAGSLLATACFAQDLLQAMNELEGQARGLNAVLSVDESTKLATVPIDFTGLSYQSAQKNPGFASKKRFLVLRR